jgi:hypothetical protein
MIRPGLLVSVWLSPELQDRQSRIQYLRSTTQAYRRRLMRFHISPLHHPTHALRAMLHPIYRMLYRRPEPCNSLVL